MDPATLCSKQSIYEKIDDLNARGHEVSYTIEGMQTIKEALVLLEEALEKNPENYELMWRYIRSASHYAEAAQMNRDALPEWKDTTRNWAKKGLDMATQAQKFNPDRVEAYYWRTVAMGQLADVTGVITAVKEGFLPKSMSDVKKAYEIDPSYLNYTTTYAYAMFLAAIPTIPFVTPGTKKSRFEDAMVYYKEYDTHKNGSHRDADEWDMKAAYTADFLREALEVLDINGCERTKYLQEIKDLCEIGMQSNRRVYQEWCREILNDTKV